MGRAALAFLLVALAPGVAKASCLGGTAQQLGAALPVPAGAVVVAGPLESDVPPAPGRADELALRVAQLVAGKIPGAHAAPKPMSLDAARASRAPALVYLRVQIVKSELRVTADAYPVVRNVWDRARTPPPPPSGHAYAAAAIDAEVRAFFPPLPLQLTSVTKASHGEGPVLAIGCGDLDGSGPEIALVTRQRVAIGRIRAGKLEVTRGVPWSVLAKRAPVPLREPLAGAAVEVGSAAFGTSDYGGVMIDETMTPLRALAGIPIGGGVCAPVSGARLAFEGTTPCSGLAVHPPVFDAASAFDLVSSAGGEAAALATREGGTLRLRVGGVEKASFDDAGAEVVVFDGNLDGKPEVAFSSDQADDAITIATLDDKGARIIGRIPAPAGVTALGACLPLDGGGAALVAAVGNEVWIVR